MNRSKKLFIFGLSALIIVTPCFAQNNIIANINVLQENRVEIATISMKIQYINWLKAIEDGMVDLRPYYDDGGGRQAAKGASIEYQRWDDALNEIYGVLKQELPSNTMEELRQSQREWIIYRDNEAQKATEEWGSLWKEFGYLTAQVYHTKLRCYYLVNTYM